MRTYRMAIDASVCVSIRAESEDEAKRKAMKLAREEYVEGLNVNVPKELDMRVYLSEAAEPTVEDVEE